MTNKKNAFVPINKGQFSLETEDREQLFEKNRGYGVEKEYKTNRKLWSEYPKKQHVSEYPLHVDLELSAVCNLQCPMCYTISPEFKEKVNAKYMDFNLFKKIIDECSEGNVYSIRLSFRGESFLYKNIVECIRYAKSKGIKEVSTLTNGLRLDEEMFEEIMKAGMDWITISFDGLGETYEQIRKPAKYDRAVEKITNYAQIKKSFGKVKPVIKIQSILPAVQDNLQEFYEVFKPISDLVYVNPLIDFHQSKKNLPKIKNFSCPEIYQRIVVGADGLCMMCANDESGKVIIGDANKQSIKEIWHGPVLTKVREQHSRHVATDEISACSECYLPIETYQQSIAIGDRGVVAEKYLQGTQKVFELHTPEKFRRKDLKV